MNTRDKLLQAIDRACGIIETADHRNLHCDDPSGPPDMTAKEWRQLYWTLDKARTYARKKVKRV